VEDGHAAVADRGIARRRAHRLPDEGFHTRSSMEMSS
jgi:hypothetical protein